VLQRVCYNCVITRGVSLLIYQEKENIEKEKKPDEGGKPCVHKPGPNMDSKSCFPQT